jgi:ribosomal protein L29
MNQTWSKFKSKIKDLKREEKEALLKELHEVLIAEYTKAHRGGNVKTMNIRLLRKQIAYLKTIMNQKGFNYNPR